MSTNQSPPQTAEILFLCAVMNRDRTRWIAWILHARRVPKQNDLADGWAERIIAENVLLHLVWIGTFPQGSKMLQHLLQ
jgi:hypothetical protein